MATLHETLEPEVRAFVEREGIGDALATALRLIGESFPETRDVCIELMYDPENPQDEWVSVTYRLTSPAPDLRDRDAYMLDRYIAEVPWPRRDKVVLLPWPGS